MPIYRYTCEACNGDAELDAAITEDRIAPTCCGAPMYHDYQKERFRGIAQKEKGTEYATGFLETFENHGTKEQVFIKSREHHMQELDKRGLRIKGNNPETIYSRKHAKDRIPVQKRINRGY